MVIEVYWDNEAEGRHCRTLIDPDGVPSAIHTTLKVIHRWDCIPTHVLGVKVLDVRLRAFQLYPSECVKCLDLAYGYGGSLPPLRLQQRFEDARRWRDLPSQIAPALCTPHRHVDDAMVAG